MLAFTGIAAKVRHTCTESEARLNLEDKIYRASTVRLHACALRLRYVAFGATRDYVTFEIEVQKSLRFIHIYARITDYNFCIIQ